MRSAGIDRRERRRATPTRKAPGKGGEGMKRHEAEPAPDSVARHLRCLRRHARMLLGEQRSADDLVAEALNLMVAEERSAQGNMRVTSFRALYDALGRRSGQAIGLDVARDRASAADARLQALSTQHRAAFLLTAAENFTVAAVAAIMRRSTGDVGRLTDEGQAELERALRTSVLIIEDEWAIARDLRRIVSDLGHTVAAVAPTRDAAVAAVRGSLPGLVLADIQLADGSSGVDAVRAIFEEGSAPTVFITAFPERLLTGRRPEPTYLVTKPYSPAMIQATVSQALFFTDGARPALD